MLALMYCLFEYLNPWGVEGLKTSSRVCFKAEELLRVCPGTLHACVCTYIYIHICTIYI